MLTIQDYLTQQGWQPTHYTSEHMEGHCPFPWHQDHDPSFAIYHNRRSPYWRCFGQCDETGDIIRLIHHMEFSDDEKMARAYARYEALNNGVPIKVDRRRLQPDRYPARQEHPPANEEQQALMTAMAEWWNWQLWKQNVLDYLHSRGVPDSTFKLDQTPSIGYAPPASESWVLPARSEEHTSELQSPCN